MNKKDVVVKINEIINCIINDNSLFLPDFLENIQDGNGENLDLVNDLNFDSLMLIAMVVEIENEFYIEFPVEALLFDTLRSLRNIYDTVWALINDGKE